MHRRELCASDKVAPLPEAHLQNWWELVSKLVFENTALIDTCNDFCSERTKKVSNNSTKKNNNTANRNSKKSLVDIYQNVYLHLILQDKNPTTKPSASKRLNLIVLFIVCFIISHDYFVQLSTYAGSFLLERNVLTWLHLVVEACH